VVHALHDRKVNRRRPPLLAWPRIHAHLKEPNRRRVSSVESGPICRRCPSRCGHGSRPSSCWRPDCRQRPRQAPRDLQRDTGRLLRLWYTVSGHVPGAVEVEETSRRVVGNVPPMPSRRDVPVDRIDYLRKAKSTRATTGQRVGEYHRCRSKSI